MFIQNQDKDRIYNIKSVNWKLHKCEGIIMGYNIYGTSMSGKKTYLLGTYDCKSDAEQICSEINRFFEKNIDIYSMPEPSEFDNFDIYEMLGGFDR